MVQFWDKLGNAVNGLFGWSKASWTPSNNSFHFGQSGPVWLDTGKPRYIYDSIPQVRAVINKKAMMFSNMELKLKSIIDDSIIIDEDFNKLIRNPNIMQSMNDWLENYKIQEQVYGNQFIYKNKPSPLTKYPVSLKNISPRFMQPILTGKFFDQTEMSGIVSKFAYTEMGVQKYFDTECILWSRITDIDNPLVGTSPIFSLKYPVSNIEVGYKFLNVTSSQKGAIGMLTNAGKDSMGAIPLKPEERERVEKEYVNKYGINDEQRKILITGSALTWQSMTIPIRETMVLEQLDAYTMTIIDHFGLNVNIFSNKNATFENVKASILQCYRDTIQPEADRFAQVLGAFLQIPDGTKLEASYEHLDLFKENKEKGMAAIQSMITWLTGAIQGRLIDVNQAQEILGNELGIELNVVNATP